MIAAIRFIALAVPALAASCLALAQGDRQVVYRLVDQNGKTTYSEKAPGSDYKGKVTRIDVDLKANSATLRPLGDPSPAVSLPLTAPELDRVRADAELARATQALQEANKALEAGKEPAEDEKQIVGNAGGGVRIVLTEAYQARIGKLQDAVKAAQEEVERARRAARQAAID